METQKKTALTQLKEIEDAGLIGGLQARSLRGNLRGEESSAFVTIVSELYEIIQGMPLVTDDDDTNIAHLHYFSPLGDWWIMAKDVPPTPGGWGPQTQAFGYARFNNMPECAEYGYINLHELFAVTGLMLQVELDCYWTPTPMADVIAKL